MPALQSLPCRGTLGKGLCGEQWGQTAALSLLFMAKSPGPVKGWELLEHTELWGCAG